MRKLLPFLLILVVLGSGCTVPVLNIDIPGLPDIPGFGGPNVVQYEHDMVIITSLEAIPAEVDAGQTVRLLAYVENRGDRPIDGVVVELYDYCQGLFDPEVTTCGSNPAAGAKAECKIGRLLPKQTLPVAWTLSQKGDPVKLKTICPPDGMKVSVTYPYTTSSLTTISLIGKDELDRTLEERTFRSTESYIVQGPGPVKPLITVEDKQPIPVFEDARTVLAFQVGNRGSGRLTSTFTEPPPPGSPGGTPQLTHVGIEKAKVSIRGIGSGAGELIPSSGADAMCFVEGYRFKENVRLIGKDSSKMLCKIDLTTLKDEVTKTASRHVEAEITYEYSFTRSVTVTVNPKVI